MIISQNYMWLTVRVVSKKLQFISEKSKIFFKGNVRKIFDTIIPKFNTKQFKEHD